LKFDFIYFSLTKLKFTGKDAFDLTSWTTRASVSAPYAIATYGCESSV